MNQLIRSVLHKTNGKQISQFDIKTFSGDDMLQKNPSQLYYTALFTFIIKKLPNMKHMYIGRQNYNYTVTHIIKLNDELFMIIQKSHIKQYLTLAITTHCPTIQIWKFSMTLHPVCRDQYIMIRYRLHTYIVYISYMYKV